MLYHLYNFLWTVIFILLLPWLFLNKNSRLYTKFAFGLSSGGNDKSIWIHALSVGEVISVKPLIVSLKEKYPDKKIFLTVKTKHGMEVAKKTLSNKIDGICFLPLDFWWSIAKTVRHINPEIFILVETDIWPGLLHHLKKKEIKIILVNGRVSPRTFKGYKKLSFYFRSILNEIDLLLMQSELDSSRLWEVGVSPEKLKTVGNMKFDRDWTPMTREEHDEWAGKLKIRDGVNIFIAGSTHEGEEEIILRVYKKLLENFPELILILAPRKIDGADDIYKLSISMGLATLKRTDLEKNEDVRYSVLILNTIGELERVYGLGTVSFVGGSMVPIGGHNLLEPAVFGCPVLYGKYMHNFVLMSELLAESGGGRMIKDEEDLFNTLEQLLTRRNISIKMGKNAGNFVKKNSGAVKRIMGLIGGYIASN